MMHLARATAVCALLAGVTLLRPVGTPTAAQSAVALLPTPAGAGSGMYGMSADGRGGAHLIWIEPDPEAGGSARAHRLQFSSLAGGRWAPARTIARSGNWFVNWADHPTLAVLADGALVAHWLVNNGEREGVYGYGIRAAYSGDDGATWREIFAEGTRNQRDYSGFLTFLPGADAFDAVYLTPLVSDGDSHEMTLGLARFGADGTVRSRTTLDTDACSCCTTTMVRTPRGVVVAYRDHEPGEIRDIAVVREVGGRWTEPKPVHRDGWEINACPTNGPVLAARGNRLAVAWFTAAGDVPRVKVAFSPDAAETFSEPTIVDGGRPVGWPALAMLDDGSVAVSWLESRGGGEGEIRLRRVSPSGRAGAVVTIAPAAAGRSTGIPQMVRAGDRLVLAWRSDERVVTATVPFPPG